MLIKFKLDGKQLLDIARATHVAPCQILVQNGVRTETELMTLDEIVVDVHVKNLIH